MAGTEKTDLRTLSIDKIAEGDSASVPFRIDADAMADFARLSGDVNPLHTDSKYAHSVGFQRAVVYGGLILAQVSRLIGMDLPGRHAIWNGIRMDFRAPLYVDEDAVLTGTVAQVSEATRTITVSLLVESGDRTVASGKAYVSVRNPESAI